MKTTLLRKAAFVLAVAWCLPAQGQGGSSPEIKAKLSAASVAMQMARQAKESWEKEKYREEARKGFLDVVKMCKDESEWAAMEIAARRLADLADLYPRNQREDILDSAQDALDAVLNIAKQTRERRAAVAAARGFRYLARRESGRRADYCQSKAEDAQAYATTASTSSPKALADEGVSGKAQKQIDEGQERLRALQDATTGSEKRRQRELARSAFERALNTAKAESAWQSMGDAVRALGRLASLASGSDRDYLVQRASGGCVSLLTLARSKKNRRAALEAAACYKYLAQVVGGTSARGSKAKELMEKAQQAVKTAERIKPARGGLDFE